MKPGITTLERPRVPGAAPTVNVGRDDRMVCVDFGTITLMISAPPGSEGLVIVTRAYAYDAGDRPLPVDVTMPQDVRGSVEFHLQEGHR